MSALAPRTQREVDALRVVQAHIRRAEAAKLRACLARWATAEAAQAPTAADHKCSTACWTWPDDCPHLDVGPVDHTTAGSWSWIDSERLAGDVAERAEHGGSR